MVVDASLVEREIEVGKEQARAEGKPEDMLEKIALGKLNKFYKENTLLSQAFVKDNSKSIAQYLDESKRRIDCLCFQKSIYWIISTAKYIMQKTNLTIGLFVYLFINSSISSTSIGISLIRSK